MYSLFITNLFITKCHLSGPKCSWSTRMPSAYTMDWEIGINSVRKLYRYKDMCSSYGPFVKRQSYFKLKSRNNGDIFANASTKKSITNEMQWQIKCIAMKISYSRKRITATTAPIKAINARVTTCAVCTLQITGNAYVNGTSHLIL